MGRRPVYVDLDVGQGSISVPGSLGKIFIGVFHFEDLVQNLLYNYRIKLTKGINSFLCINNA